jgi:outer membrane biosynthesis protein TonB
MTNGMLFRQEEEIRAQVEQVRSRLQALEADLHLVDKEADSLAPQRMHLDLLDQACGSLEKLGELGAASLFWGEEIAPAQAEERLREARGRVSAFQAKLDEVDDHRRAILAKIAFEEENLEILGDDLYQLREKEERRKQEWVVERDISPIPHGGQRMAWSRGGEDDARFRKSLVASLVFSFLLGTFLPMIDLPLPKAFEPEDMPKRLVQFIRKEQVKRFPPPPVVPETLQEQPEPEPEVPEPVDEPEPSDAPETPAIAAAEPQPSLDDLQPPGPAGPETPAMAAADPQPRQQVQKAGILAFKEKFASLAKDDVAPRLGADARYGDADDASRNQSPSRSLLTTNAPGRSAGINVASLSRNVGGGGGGGGGGEGGGAGGIQGIPVSRPTSSIASIGGGERPLARGGPGASRTDEEIQIVFDRYKARFYRLYNRELRTDPTLQGQMVLRLTIEPDGSVSMCKLQSSDMDAPELAAQVVSIVLTIDFGAKEDVQALTIVYPIDFLPATT